MTGKRPLMGTDEFKDKLFGGKLTRRDALSVLASVGVLSTAISTPSLSHASSGSDLHVFTWGGYEDESFAASYADKFGSRPQFSFFGDQAEALNKMRAGFEPEVTFPCTQILPLWYEAGVIAPLDTSLLTNWKDIAEPLKRIPTTTLPDGTRLWAPHDWGQTAVIVNTELAPKYKDPDNHSWGILYDEELAGRLGVFDAVEDHFCAVAVYLGIDFTNMTDEEIQIVADKITEGWPLIRVTASEPTNLTQALFSGEIVASMAWNSMMLSASEHMSENNTSGKYLWMVPKEGALTWSCGLCIHPSAIEHGLYEQAHELIDAYLDADSQIHVLMDWGYGVSNTKTYEMPQVTEEYLTSIGLSRDIDQFLKTGVFQTYQKNYDEISAAYEATKAMAE